MSECVPCNSKAKVNSSLNNERRIDNNHWHIAEKQKAERIQKIIEANRNLQNSNNSKLYR